MCREKVLNILLVSDRIVEEGVTFECQVVEHSYRKFIIFRHTKDFLLHKIELQVFHAINDSKHFFFTRRRCIFHYVNFRVLILKNVCSILCR